MSLETRIPKEINDYREKIVFGLSARQLLAVAIAVVLVGATAFVLCYLLQIDLKIVEYILIAEAMPIIAVGFIRYKGLSFEDYALIRLRHRFGVKRLLNKTDLDYLTSLYPVNPEGSRRKGVKNREISKKEKERRRRERPECLGEEASTRNRKRRPRTARHQQRKEKGRKKPKA